MQDFEIEIDELILARPPDLRFINNKKRTCYLTDFAILVDHK